MDIFGWEQIDHFGQYILQEFHRFGITGTDHIFGDTPLLPYIVRTACATQFRVSSQCRLLVSGKVDFGNDRDKTFFGVSNDVADFVLSIEAAVRLAVVFAGVMPDHGLFALGADFRQFRIFLDLDTPSLVVCQMPM